MGINKPELIAAMADDHQGEIQQYADRQLG
jgi:hypothetical protein